MTAQREWFEKDYYKVLGVDENISEKELTKAYRKLARQLHPDANPGDSSAEERFKEVSAAYDVLGDSKKRAEYDEARRLGPMGGGFPGGFSGDFSGGMGINMEDRCTRTALAPVLRLKYASVGQVKNDGGNK